MKEGFFEEVIVTEQRFQCGQVEEYPGFRESRREGPGGRMERS